jgi:hypothetical protein
MAEQQPEHVWRVGLCASSSRPHDQIPCLARSEREIAIMEQHESFIRWLSPRSDELSRLQAERGEVVTAVRKDAVFDASIEFIGTLTGMRPPPIEVAPPEVFKPFRDFAEKVCQIFGGEAQ